MGAKRKRKFKFFAECQDSDTRQRISLTSVRFLALDKVIKKKLCRMPNNRHSAKGHRWGSPFVRSSLPSVNLCWELGSRQRLSLPSARHSVKRSLPSVLLCQEQRSAKSLFAECPIFNTRQSIRHSAKIRFPVVI
jgi:hypothetical protein